MIPIRRKLFQKQVSNQSKPTIGLIFVSEEYDGWKGECLDILRKKFDTQIGKFAQDQEILLALQQSVVGQEGNFNQIQKLYMPF